MPIVDFGYGKNAERKIECWERFNTRRVIDVGGGKEKHIEDKFSRIAAVADILPPPHEGYGVTLDWFSGDLNLPEVWYEILQHVQLNGKFDFAICSHTLEDLRNPLLVARMLPKIANAGLITFPSIHAEARRFEILGSYRGYRHHRWIHKIVESEEQGPGILAVPKLALFEKRAFSALANWKNSEEELWVEWETDFSYELFKNDHLGPDEWSFYLDYQMELVGRVPRAGIFLKKLSAILTRVKHTLRNQ